MVFKKTRFVFITFGTSEEWYTDCCGVGGEKGDCCGVGEREGEGGGGLFMLPVPTVTSRSPLSGSSLRCNIYIRDDDFRAELVENGPRAPSGLCLCSLQCCVS